jgi:chromosome segregation ATPase
MATEKTPAHKRVKRAEEGKDQWKMKAMLRREENEQLLRSLKSKDALLLELTKQCHELKEQLTSANKSLANLEKEIVGLKKKLIK